MSRRTTIVLRNARSSEAGPEAAEQVFASLPYTPTPFGGWIPFLHPEPIAFEIAVFNQVISFQLNLPEEFEQYMSGHLAAAYPGLMFEPASQELHTLEPIYHQPHFVRNLKLINGSNYPLKSYSEFGTLDSLAPILGTLAKIPPEHMVVIQLLLASADPNWKRAGYTLAAGYTDKEGKHVANPDKPLIEEKLNQMCHRFALTLATSAPDPLKAQNLMSNLVGSFSPLTNARSNSLTTHKPFWLPQRLTNSFAHRNFTGTPKQYLSITEAATIWHLPNKNVKDIKNIAWGRTLLGEPPENLPTFDDTPEDQRHLVNFFGLADHKNERKVFGIKDEDKRRHMYVIGKSGTGKSTLLSNMIINDLKHDKGLAVIDPHGDLIEFVLDFIPSHRINDVIYLNPADTEYSVKLNLLEDNGHQFKELIASGIIAIFKKLYGHSWGPRLEYILRNSLLTLLDKDQATLEDIVKLLTNKSFRDRVVEKLDDPVLKNFWQNEFDQMQDRQRSEAVSPILNKIGQFVTSPMIRHVISSPSSSFSIEDAMNEGKILLCNLSQGKLGEDNAAMLGAMLITKIQLAAMNRVNIDEADRRDFHLYVDEFQNFATTSFIKILSEARKYRLSLILANQYVEQIDADVRSAIFGNCGTLISFLVGAADAQLLTHEFGQQYTPEDLVSIGKHQVVMKLMVDNTQSLPFPAWTLAPATNTNENRDKVIRVSRERYAKKKKSIKPDRKPDQKQSKDNVSKQNMSKSKSQDQNSNLYIKEGQKQSEIEAPSTQNQLETPEPQAKLRSHNN